MREHVSGYYAEMTAPLGDNSVAMPSILDGEPVSLLADPTQDVPVRNPDKKLVTDIRARYEGLVREAGAFLIACAYPGESPGPGELQLAHGTSRHFSSLVSFLLKPHNQPTGFRTGLQTRAVAGDEISPQSISTALGTRLNAPEEIEKLRARSVLLLTAADVHPITTKNGGYIACVSLVRAVAPSIIACTGGRLPLRELKENKSRWKPVAGSN